MQEKVKIFTGASSDVLTELEKQINKWLVDNNSISIIARKVKVATGTNIEGKTFVNCTVVIFYQEKA